MESDSKKKLKNKRRRQRRQNARKKLVTKEINEQPTASEIVPAPALVSAPVKPEPIIEMKAVKPANTEPTKSREQILAERQAKKLAKTTKKPPVTTVASSKPAVPTVTQESPVKITPLAPEKPVDKSTEKTREEVMAERAAKKQTKQQQKQGNPVTATPSAPEKPAPVENSVEKTREEVMAERAAKKQAKQQQKGKPAAAEQKPKLVPSESVDETDRVVTKIVENAILSEKMAALKIESASTDVKAKPVLSKAERRAIQEAQRAAKAAAQIEKSSKPKEKPTQDVPPKALVASKGDDKAKKAPLRRLITKPALHRVKLFDHLYVDRMSFDKPISDISLHKEVVKLGVQYANNVIVGSNARCIAFLKAMKMVIQDYKSNEQKDLCRELDNEFQPCVDFLEKCRPFSVSMKNALANIKMHKSQLTGEESDEDKKAYLLETIDTYIRDQIEKAAQAISNSVQHKISNGDVILTYGSSSLIKLILKEANDKNDRFSVIVVDSRPSHEGQAMIKRLVKEGIPCKCVQINALGFIMPEVTKVILGAHALLANGCVMGRVGTAQIALVAKSYNVPVLVCCETHKFSERVQTDAFVHNEIANPDDIMLPNYKAGDAATMADWRSLAHLTPLNIRYDITPPELVTAVITEIAILPCTSVPVILRIKPSEIGY